MQIVIDIPKDIIESAKSSPNYYPAYHFEKIWRAIAKGIPLPKGHGDLIDRNDLFITTITTDDYNGNEAIDVVLKEDVDSAQTIIEADTESEDNT